MIFCVHFFLKYFQIFYNQNNFNNNNKNNLILGFLGIIGATISETLIYFITKKLNNSNPWNTLFIAYLFPAIFLTIYLALNNDIIPKNITTNSSENKSYLSLLLIGNALIGVIGYTLRFYTINKLPSNIYGVLSYFGIVMAYVYGWMLNKEEVSLEKIFGSLIIVVSSIMIL